MHHAPPLRVFSIFHIYYCKIYSMCHIRSAGRSFQAPNTHYESVSIHPFDNVTNHAFTSHCTPPFPKRNMGFQLSAPAIYFQCVPSSRVWDGFVTCMYVNSRVGPNELYCLDHMSSSHDVLGVLLRGGARLSSVLVRPYSSDEEDLAPLNHKAFQDSYRRRRDEETLQRA